MTEHMHPVRIEPGSRDMEAESSSEAPGLVKHCQFCKLK